MESSLNEFPSSSYSFDIFSNLATKVQEMLRRTILYVAIVAIGTAAETTNPFTDLAVYPDATYPDAAAYFNSAISEYPYLKTYYSELFGADWQKTILDVFSNTEYLSDYLSYYSTYSVDTLTDLEAHTDAAYLISKVNEYPSVRVFYSEAYGADWEKTILLSYAAGFYKEYLTGFALLYNAYGTSYTDSTYDTESYLAHIGSFDHTSFTDYSAYASYYRSFTSSYFSDLSLWYGTDTIGYSRAIYQVSATNFGYYLGATIGSGGTGPTTTLSSSSSGSESGFTTGDSGNFQTTGSSQSSRSSASPSEESTSYSGSASGSTLLESSVQESSSPGTSTSGSSTSGNPASSTSSTSSTAGVYSIGIPFVGLFAALIAVL